ncbi:MAG: hypothetical protein K8U57_01835 [Planctomycetes bacterium]|nr:hypothetical protein [Planctomycetota bacterium]
MPTATVRDQMTLMLGPMPETVRATVRRLIESAGEPFVESDRRFVGFVLWGGPGGCDIIDADGEVWSSCAWSGTTEHVPDGPRKVGAVAIAADREPGLALWLPQRPPSASDCGVCGGVGSWPQMNGVQCPECVGLGWLPELPVQCPGG